MLQTVPWRSGGTRRGSWEVEATSEPLRWRPPVGVTGLGVYWTQGEVLGTELHV